MTKQITASAGGTRVVNNTCNVLHVARSAQFNASSVLKQIMEAQGMLATGTTLPPDFNSVYGGQTGVSWIGTDTSSDVIGCSWAKDLDGVVGTLSIHVKPRKRYLDMILPGDVLFVFMDDAGRYDPSGWSSGTLVTVVVVDRVGELTRVQNMATTRDITITARDLAVILSESLTVMDQAFAVLENARFTGEFIGRLFGDKKQNALSPLENVLILLLLLYDADETGSKLNELQWKLSATSATVSAQQLVSLIDVTTYVQNPLPFYSLAEPPGIVQAANVWSLLESYANTLTNEFFIDVRDENVQEQELRRLQSLTAGETYFEDNFTDITNQNLAVQAVIDSGLFRSGDDNAFNDNASLLQTSTKGTSGVALVMRQRPYDDDTFNALPYTEVDVTEIDSLDVARSSHDVYNWFRVRFPILDVKYQELIKGIRIVPQSIAKFGFRRMEGETRYLFTSSEASAAFSHGGTKTDFSDVFSAYIDLLSSWFAQNEYWLAGHLSMRFKPSIRVGTRLRVMKNGAPLYDFYVQGVQHNFSASPGGSRSSFTITRGRSTDNPNVPTPIVSDFQHDGFSVTDGGQ